MRGEIGGIRKAIFMNQVRRLLLVVVVGRRKVRYWIEHFIFILVGADRGRQAQFTLRMKKDICVILDISIINNVNGGNNIVSISGGCGIGGKIDHSTNFTWINAGI